MDSIIDDPDHWQERAENARVLAKQLKDQNMQNIMEDIARGYERIADLITRNLKDANHGSR